MPECACFITGCARCALSGAGAAGAGAGNVSGADDDAGLRDFSTALKVWTQAARTTKQWCVAHTATMHSIRMLCQDVLCV